MSALGMKKKYQVLLQVMGLAISAATHTLTALCHSLKRKKKRRRKKPTQSNSFLQFILHSGIKLW